MKRMNRKIFKNIFFVSVIILIATLSLTMGVVYKSDSDTQKKILKNEAIGYANTYNASGLETLKAVTIQRRLTVIDANGTVIYDNQKDARYLENHSDRKEFQEAIKNGEGYASRYSSTLSEKTVNVAIQLSDGRVLRLSDVQATMLSILTTALSPIILVFLVAIVLSLFLSLRVSRSITSPINRIDLEHPKKTVVYEELLPLAQRISDQNHLIARQMEDQDREHEKQDAMRRDFTANVSHELKTPLTSISGYAEIIKNGIARPEDIPNFAGKIYDESQRLITLVGDIIKLSQLDGKEIPVKIEEIDLYDTCEAVISHLEMAAKKKNIALSLCGEHLKIHGAEQIVEEMIFNICDNAIKYNKQDGKVTIAIRQCVDGVELTVKDTGIGIPQDDMPHIYERFFRVDKSHSKEIGGTGLGLSIVKHAAMFMDAKVSIESTVGEGTTARVLF